MLADFKKITCFVFDVDGVLTNGNLLVMPNGLMARTMNIKDGYAIQLAIKKGYKVWIISGGNSDEVKERLEKLGVSQVFMKVTDKKVLLEELSILHSTPMDQILYMGDDMPDVEVMKSVFLPTCPADACDEVIAIAKYISSKNGGKGCVRDVIEKVLKLNNDWE